jgi:hypothetical protein
VSVCDDGCDLYESGLEPGSRPRRARGVNTGDHDEVALSVWAGNLVFGRRAGPNRITLYAKGARGKLERLPGLGTTRCGAIEPPSCRPVADVDLQATELRGRWVAQSWTYQPDDFGGHAQNEIRLTDLGGTRDLRLASMTTGCRSPAATRALRRPRHAGSTGATICRGRLSARPGFDKDRGVP